jgi:hypothetical protein
LIALHHLDAPWRPADVEQREGRILRQGNKNPSVQIYRYVTEGSFDAYMWQTLETKAKFINQIMTGDTHVRRVEDIDSAVLTYAEVKAIASGNPLVMEKASVDSEVARLGRLRAQHHQTQFRIRNSIRQLTQDLELYGKRISGFEHDLIQRVETRGDKFEIQLNGQRFTEREKAGDFLNLIAQKAKGRNLDYSLGDFAGFKVLLHASPLEFVEISLQGKNIYTAKIGESGLGTIRSVEHAAQSIDQRLSDTKEATAQAEIRLAEFQKQENQPFEHEEKLQQLVARQQEIVKVLDITKNQAPASVQTESVPKQGEKLDIAPKRQNSRIRV